MKERERITTFWKRWAHEPKDQEVLSKFRARVNEVAREAWDLTIRSEETHLFAEKFLTQFAFYSGTAYTPPYPGRSIEYKHSSLARLLVNARTIYDVIEAIQSLLWALTSSSVFGTQLKECCAALNRVFDITPNVPVQVIFDGKEAVIYPTGAELLDQAVIESNLLWLGNYPTVVKHFEDALKIYLGKDVGQYRNILDNLRFAVEQMLRAVLNNQKALENQKEVLLQWLSLKGAHSQIVTMYSVLLAHFALYQNEAVKHKEDKYTPAEIEFVLYLTGTFLRFIQRVAQSSTEGVPAPC